MVDLRIIRVIDATFFSYPASCTLQPAKLLDFYLFQLERELFLSFSVTEIDLSCMPTKVALVSKGLVDNKLFISQKLVPSRWETYEWSRWQALFVDAGLANQPYIR